MRIIIDAMGGDNAPEAFLRGTFRHAEQQADTHVQYILVGRVEALLRKMSELGYQDLPKNVELLNADDMVDMHDDPANVLHTRKDSSMVVGLKLLADGQGDAFLSAGSTGALLSAATLTVRRIKGIRRAAFCPAVPCKGGRCVIIDAGANAECTPEFLLQFGCMGSVYAAKSLHLEQPRVGLLNIGTEDSKGDELHKQAYALLKDAGERGLIRFVGNVEARDVPFGAVDVVTCDGFSGNVLLKSIEGTGMFMASLMKSSFHKNLRTKLGGLLARSGLRDIKELMDYSSVGGTMLLGLNKPVIKAHGSSNEKAVYHAIDQAIWCAETGVCELIRENVDAMKLPKEACHAGA